jgi:geranylgeranyl diphosphate synthase, type I
MSVTTSGQARLIVDQAAHLVTPALRSAVDSLDPRMRLIASYQLGWCDAEGNPADAGGKGLRATMAIVSAGAEGGSPADGIPGAVAVELVHNFSLLHDDVMDRDLERRHRPTGWVAFGDGQAILAGNAMLTLAFDVLVADKVNGPKSLAHLSRAVQGLISGQSDDLALEQSPSVDLDGCLAMEAGKTAALMACSASIGAVCAGASDRVITALSEYGFELGLAFQIVDDILGISGDPAVTGKSSSSDVRAGKRSAPVVAALTSGTAAGNQLAALLAGGPPESEEDVALATALIEEAGGLSWAAQEADDRLQRALAHLAVLPADSPVRADLTTLARFVVERDR